MGNPLFGKKPLDALLKEAGDTGEHSLKRALGPVNLVTLGIGAIIGAGIFVLTGSAAGAICRTSHHAVLHPGGIGLCVCRTLLRRVSLR
jgi:hypothetical protein